MRWAIPLLSSLGGHGETISGNRNHGTATNPALFGSLTSEIHELLLWGVRPPHSRMSTSVARTARILSMDYVSYLFILLFYFVYIIILIIFSRKFLMHCSWVK